MLDVAKMDLTLPPRPVSEDILLGDLLADCDRHPDMPLVFTYGGRTVAAGYHVTEVKAAQFAALDCGANPEAWSEIFVQLWDVQDGDRTHMLAGKFAAIIRKVSEHVALADDARLTFEVSDGVAPIQLHAGGSPRLRDGKMRLPLTPRAASCKPRDRWLETRRNSACCGGTSDPACG